VVTQKNAYMNMPIFGLLSPSMDSKKKYNA
jgi:hypothetical protein